MKETMGQIIRRLRKEQNLTQEELAEQLNISAQAVSKWENESSLPDISQVVPIANLFGVPTDVLFGMYGTDSDKEVEDRLAEIFRMTDNCRDGEEGPTALAILDKYRELMRLYPNNDSILTNAMAFANTVLDNNRAELCELIGESGIHDLENEIVRWAGLVIKYSSSIDEVLSAKQSLIDVFLRQKNYEAALETVKDFPLYTWCLKSYVKTRVLHEAGKREEEQNERGWYISELFRAFVNQVYMIENIYVEQEKYAEALYCCEAIRDITEAIYRGETYRPPLMYDYQNLFHTHALCLVKLGRKKEAVDVLKKCVNFIKAQEKNFNKKTDLNIPLFPNVRFSYGFGGNAEYEHAAERIKRIVMDEAFKSLADIDEYKALAENAIKES